MVVVADIGVGRQKKTANESLRPVGGGGVRRWCGTAEKDHQRVLVTRWWSWLAALAWDAKKRPPTSLNDSLVVVVGGVGVGQREKTTNES